MSITTREQLIHQLQFNSFFSPEETTFARQFLELLESPGCYNREHLPGHITGSAWVVNRHRNQVLLVHHAKLNRWLQPGGHADGNENIFQVALREVQEETGLFDLTILLEGLFDIDIHPIPASKDSPEHLHYDVRFAFIAKEHEALTVSGESHEVRWIPLDEVAGQTHGNPSIKRMLEKTLRLIAS
jgi:8-oxo-dGTP pyrophosphatase MutT (NUDIX family)